MPLSFEEPVKLNDHFKIPADTSEWGNDDYVRARNKAGMTPNRPRASFKSFNKGMDAYTDYGDNLSKTFGVYLIGFDYPQPAFYVGVAGNDGKSPEGVSSRIMKHRVKATGSHVGATTDTTGGVHHPARWQKFARLRAKYFQESPSPDECQDAKLVVGQLTSGEVQPTQILEYFEHLIFENEKGIRDHIYALLWPENDRESVFFLTSASNNGHCPVGETPEIHLWNGKIHTF